MTMTSPMRHTRTMKKLAVAVIAAGLVVAVPSAAHASSSHDGSFCRNVVLGQSVAGAPAQTVDVYLENSKNSWRRFDMRFYRGGDEFWTLRSPAVRPNHTRHLQIPWADASSMHFEFGILGGDVLCGALVDRAGV